ncbi:MAG: calcium-binding protein [Geitlerinemataceae cyanobacterium]
MSVNLTLTINTDIWPEETTWKIFDDMGEVVADGGPFAETLEEIAIIKSINLPGTGDYTFEIFDSFGDGILAPGGYELVEDETGTVLAGPSFSDFGEATAFTISTLSTSNPRLVGTRNGDLILGDTQDDALMGQAGNDTLRSFDGKDRINGGTGEDELFGGNGNDLLKGNAGEDILRGGSNDDKLFGGTGDDELFGGNGNDLLKGEDDNDFLRGESGEDTLIGGMGSDILDGLRGNDVLIGVDSDNPGLNEFDILSGGRGEDTFVLGDDVQSYYLGDGAFGFALITDFDLKGEADKIQVFGTASDYTFNNFNGNTEISQGGDLIAVVENASIMEVVGALV